MQTKSAILTCAVPFLLLSGVASAADAPRVASAVKSRDTKAVQGLLAQKADVNAPLPDGTTALHWAAHWDEVATADLLLRAGAKVDIADASGVTPLALASTNGSGAMVERLLAAGADANKALPTGETPLMIAARTGKVDALEALLKRKVDVNAVEPSKGQTALMWAAAKGNTAAVKVLLAKGADVRATSKSGFTPLLFAARTGDQETLRLLLEAGSSVKEASSNGTTALILALTARKFDTAELLLDKGADPNGGPGFSPLHWVAVQVWRGGDSRLSITEVRGEGDNRMTGEYKLKFMKKLLALGADPNKKADKPAGLGQQNRGIAITGATPFLVASAVADLDAMRLLLASGADPKAVTNSRTTALMLATGVGIFPGIPTVPEERALDAAKLCLESGVDVNAANDNGETALIAATYRGIGGATTLVQVLIDKGANVNANNKRGWTPLVMAEGIFFAAANTANAETAELLRKWGATPSPADLNRVPGILNGEVWYPVGREPATLGSLASEP